jgi:hypothetical protein
MNKGLLLQHGTGKLANKNAATFGFEENPNLESEKFYPIIRPTTQQQNKRRKYTKLEME